jgi:uncharacterized membrane protein YhaH (DUF805 family)
LIVLLLISGLSVLDVAKENTKLRRSRREFLLRIVAGISFFLAIGIISFLLGYDEVTTNGVATLFWFVIVCPFYQLFVRRARDAGMGKLIAYLTIIPGVFLVTTPILLIHG